VEGPVLVVGATGFIGGALLRELVSEGREVRALARSDDSARKISELGAEPVQADVLDLPSLRAAMQGCELVFHAGGLNSLCPEDPNRLFEINVEGSANVVVAAAGTRVSRVVYTSSAATLGEEKGSVGDENTSHRGSFLSSYEHSKYLAERRVLELGTTLGVAVVCVSPSSVQGPGRTRGTARWLIRYANGQLRWMVDTRVSVLDIADCTRAHLLAAEKGTPGQRYVLSGGTLGIKELIELVADVTGRSYPVRYVPAVFALAGAALVEGGSRLVGRRPPVCREMVRTLLHGHAYDGSRAARQLGFSYTPMADFMRATIDWYESEGLVQLS
jgi:dihydroflavonol-4-reductase